MATGKSLEPKLMTLAGEAKGQHGTWRKAGAALGVPYATLYHIAHGNAAHVSRDAEKQVRRALGLKVRENPIRLTVPADMAEAVQAARAQGRTTRDILTRGLDNG